MTDGKSPPSKAPSEELRKKICRVLKNTFSRPQSPSTSPLPSVPGQENLGHEIPSVSHAIVVSGARLGIPGIGASATTNQQGISYVSLSHRQSAQYAVHRTPTPISRSQPSSSSSGPPASVQGEQILERMRFVKSTCVCRPTQSQGPGWRRPNWSFKFAISWYEYYHIHYFRTSSLRSFSRVHRQTHRDGDRLSQTNQ